MDAFYARVSTSHEDQKNSLKNQQQHWEQIIKERNLIPYQGGMLATRKGTEKLTNGVFADSGISGTSLKHRTAFNSLIEIALSGGIQNIYCSNISRFARDVVGAVQVIRRLNAAGIILHFENENISTDTQAKYFELELRLILAEQESRETSSKIKFGISKLQQQGGWLGSPPYGYKVINKNLQVIQEQAQVVKTIYELYDSGYGIGKIARYLNANNIITQKGNHWSQAQVSRILENEIYNGKQVQHTEQMLDVNTNQRMQIPQSEQIVHHIQSLKIVDDDLYKSVQNELLRRKQINKVSRYSSKHVLSNMLYCCCGSCFKRKISHTKDRHVVWCCNVRDMYGEIRCNYTLACVKEDDILNAIKEELKHRKNDKLGYIYNAAKDKYLEKIQQVNVQQLQDEKNNLSMQLSQLRSDKVMGLVPDSLYIEETRSLANRIEEINNTLNEYSNQQKHLQQLSNQYEDYIKMLNKLDINSLDNKTLKRIFSKIYVKARIVNGKKKLYCKFEYNVFSSTEDELLALDTGLWTPI